MECNFSPMSGDIPLIKVAYNALEDNTDSPTSSAEIKLKQLSMEMWCMFALGYEGASTGLLAHDISETDLEQVLSRLATIHSVRVSKSVKTKLVNAPGPLPFPLGLITASSLQLPVMRWKERARQSTSWRQMGVYL